MQRHDDLSMLIRAMEIGPSNAILEQEAQGQRDFVNSAVLPKRCIGCERADIEAMGIVFGDDADDLFVNVTLPVGWKKEPTSHSMWSNLLDGQGRTRAAIFYKAAFYDRDAHISVCRAINVSHKYGDDETVRVVVTQGDAVLFETETISRELKGQAYFTAIDAAEAAAIAWVDTNYPDWRSAAAYW